MSESGSSIHGTAFLIGEIGLVVLGRSGSGKSMLAAGLAVAPVGTPFRLVADDRIRIAAVGGPVADFIGRIELRGFGMAELPAMPSAVLRGIIRLTPEEPPRLPSQPIEIEAISGISLPCLQLRDGVDCTTRFLTKWPHFRQFICNG
jgi:hypothetical protein